MNSKLDNNTFFDLNSLDTLRSKAQSNSNDKGAIKAVAQQLEGEFVQMLIKSMRDANKLFKDGDYLNSQYTEFYEKMYDQQLSQNLSSKGVIGLADIIQEQLDPASANMIPATALKGNSFLKMNAGNNSVSMQDLQLKDQIKTVTVDANKADVPYATTTIDKVLSGEKVIYKEEAQTVVPPNSLEFKNKGDFVAKLYPYALRAAKALGTVPEVIIAQAALETGWGQKIIRNSGGELSNNLFNIKADKNWQGAKAQVKALEYDNGVAVMDQSNFKVYSDMSQSFSDYVNYLKHGVRYQDALQTSAPEEFIKAVHEAGYATDPQYANKVINIMKSIAKEFGTALTDAVIK